MSEGTDIETIFKIIDETVKALKQQLTEAIDTAMSQQGFTQKAREPALTQKDLPLIKTLIEAKLTPKENKSQITKMLDAEFGDDKKQVRKKYSENIISDMIERADHGE